MTPERRRLAEYLLGTAPAADSATITEQLFEDESLPAELEEVERDLVDAYAQGQLSPADALALEAAARQSASLQERMQFARALAANRQPRRNLSRFWVATAAGLMILLGVGILRLITTNSRLESQLAAVRRTQPQPPQSPTLAVMITPLERGAAPGTRISLDNPAALIRLNFAIEMAPNSKADIRIRTQAGALLLEQHAVAPTASVIGVSLDAKDLPPGLYTAEIVEPDGHQVDYAFEVTAPTPH